MADDLWPVDIAESDMVTPVAILREQAALLGDKTKQLVTGEVTTQVPSTALGIATPFVHSFAVVAPTLSYRYELLQVTHGIKFYPLTIRQGANSVTANNEAEFKERLKAMLAAQHTLDVVRSILAQVRA